MRKTFWTDALSATQTMAARLHVHPEEMSSPCDHTKSKITWKWNNFPGTPAASSSQPPSHLRNTGLRYGLRASAMAAGRQLGCSRAWLGFKRSELWFWLWFTLLWHTVKHFQSLLFGGEAENLAYAGVKLLRLVALCSNSVLNKAAFESTHWLECTTAKQRAKHFSLLHVWILNKFQFHHSWMLLFYREKQPPRTHSEPQLKFSCSEMVWKRIVNTKGISVPVLKMYDELCFSKFMTTMLSHDRTGAVNFSD